MFWSGIIFLFAAFNVFAMQNVWHCDWHETFLLEKWMSVQHLASWEILSLLSSCKHLQGDIFPKCVGIRCVTSVRFDGRVSDPSWESHHPAASSMRSSANTVDLKQVKGGTLASHQLYTQQVIERLAGNPSLLPSVSPRVRFSSTALVPF